jgi:hypothetical protein
LIAQLDEATSLVLALDIAIAYIARHTIAVKEGNLHKKPTQSLEPLSQTSSEQGKA